MTQLLVELPDIRKGMIELTHKYPHIAQLCPDPVETIKRSKYDDVFHGLVKIVAGQQISTKAAASVWQRVVSFLGYDFMPETVLQQNENDLRACGLSGRKVEYIRIVAEAIQSGSLVLENFSKMADDAIATEIVNLKGFGKWSADMFLLFGLGRGNIWADGDLGVRLGLQIFLGQDNRPDDGQMRHYKNIFAPYGSAASLLMWHIKQHENK